MPVMAHRNFLWLVVFFHGTPVIAERVFMPIIAQRVFMWLVAFFPHMPVMAQRVFMWLVVIFPCMPVMAHRVFLWLVAVFPDKGTYTVCVNDGANRTERDGLA